MFEIPLFLLFLQIGFNAALNNRAYNKNPKTARNIHSDKSDLGYTSRWGVSDENSDSEYYNSQPDEEYDFRSFQPQRQNDLRYNTKPNLETASVGRINANNYADVFQTFSSSSRRLHPNYRRPFSGIGPPGLRQEHTRNYYRKANGDSHLQISSSEGSNPKHASRLGEQASSFDPLLPFIEQSNNRRGQTDKYNSKENSFSDDASPIDKFYAAFSSNSQNKRRNYRKEYSNNNLNTRKSSDGLNLDDENSNNLSPFRGIKPGLKSHKLTKHSPLIRRVNRKKYKLFPNEDDTGQLTFLRLSSSEDLSLELPLLRSHDQTNNRKSNSWNYLTLSLSPHNKDFSKLLTLDELYIVPVNFRRTGSSSNKSNRRENDNLSAEEDNLSNLSDLSLKSIEIPNFELPLLRSSEPSYKKIKRSLKQHRINQASLKKLFNDDTVETLVPYHEGKSRIKSSDTEHLRHDIQHPWDDILRPDTNKSVKGPASLELRLKSQQWAPEDKDNSEHTTDVLPLEYPWIETVNSNKKQNNTTLRSHDQNERDKNTRDVLPLEYPSIDTLSSKKMQNKTKLRSHDKNENDKNTSRDVLHLEYPWIDTLSSKKMQNKTKLRSRDQNESHKNTKDVLPLEYSWIDTLSSKKKQNNTKLKSHYKNESDKNTKDMLPLEYPWINTLRSKKKQNKTKLKSHDQNESYKNTRDVLPLEYPWIDTLRSKKKQNKTKLKSHDQNESYKNTRDVLPLEYPWIDRLSSKKKQNKTKLISHDKNESDKNTRDVLPLEYPWIDTLRSKKKQNKTKLRSYGQNQSFEDTTNVLPLQYPWTDTLSSNRNKNKSKLSGNYQNKSVKNTTDTLALEYPWIDTLSSNRKKKKSKLRSHDKTVKDSTDVLPLQYPWNDALKHNRPISQKYSCRDKKPKRKSRPNKLSSKKSSVRKPEPIFVHPYLRNRKNKHSDYFRRSYDRFNDGLRLQHILDTPRSNRSFKDNQKQGVLPIARGSGNHKPNPKNFDPYEGSSDDITFPSDRSAKSSRL